MTQKELQQLDELLAKREKELEEELSKIAIKNPAVKGDFEVRVPPNVEGREDEDQYAHNVSDLERNFALEQELEKQIEEVRKARTRIKAGTYGVCEKCASEIQPARLKLIPVAALCMDCLKK